MQVTYHAQQEPFAHRCKHHSRLQDVYGQNLDCKDVCQQCPHLGFEVAALLLRARSPNHSIDNVQKPSQSRPCHQTLMRKTTAFPVHFTPGSYQDRKSDSAISAPHLVIQRCPSGYLKKSQRSSHQKQSMPRRKTGVYITGVYGYCGFMMGVILIALFMT